MNNMNLPEWTAQAFVATGAVFLLISAYVMGVMVPNGLLAPNDFDVNYYFDGDIKTFDLDTETGTGAFVDDVGSGSYEPTKAKDGGGATLNLVGKPSGEDYTSLSQNFSLTTDGIDGDGVWLGTISDTSDNPALLNRKTYEVDGKQGAWTPTNLPETGKEYVFPNPVNGDYDDTFTCSDERTMDGVEVITCSAEPEAGTKMTFVPGAGSDLELLKNTFEGRNSGAGPGSAPMWFSYRTEQIVGTELGGVIARVYNVTVYMEAPTMLYLEDNFNFTTFYEGRVGSINTATYQTRYYDATGFRAGCVNKESSTDTHINVLGYLRIFENEYDENGTMLSPNYGFQSSDGCWDSYRADNDNIENPDTDSFQELVNVTYNVSRTSLQYEDGYYDSDGDGDGFNFFSPTCDTISVTDRTCWIPAADASWPNAMHNLHIQNYTFISETDVNGTLAFHFNANETNIPGNSGSLYNENLGTGLVMDYYEDVWVDPVTGTVLDQKYSIQIFVPSKDDARFFDEEGNATPAQLGFDGAMLRDIVANYTQESQEAAASTAKLQALAQYYQGHEMVVLTLNGAYTEKTVDGQIDAEKDKVASYTLGTKTLPTILIGLAMVSLMVGFYVYYQTGGAISGGGMDEPSSEAEPSSSMATVEEKSTEDEAADDSSDGDEESDSDDDEEGDGGDDVPSSDGHLAKEKE
jgi:hypothetical protein